MRRNISSVLVVIVGVILAVDVAIRLAPKEATAQPPGHRPHGNAVDLEIHVDKNGTTKKYILWETGRVTNSIVVFPAAP